MDDKDQIIQRLKLQLEAKKSTVEELISLKAVVAEQEEEIRTLKHSNAEFYQREEDRKTKEGLDRQSQELEKTIMSWYSEQHALLREMNRKAVYDVFKLRETSEIVVEAEEEEEEDEAM